MQKFLQAVNMLAALTHLTAATIFVAAGHFWFAPLFGALSVCCFVAAVPRHPVFGRWGSFGLICGRMGLWTGRTISRSVRLYGSIGRPIDRAVTRLGLAIGRAGERFGKHMARWGLSKVPHHRVIS